METTPKERKPNKVNNDKIHLIAYLIDNIAKSCLVIIKWSQSTREVKEGKKGRKEKKRTHLLLAVVIKPRLKKETR